jgi:hypothetical protein
MTENFSPVAASAARKKTTPRATTRKPTQLTDAELKFLRDEILKVIVSSIAAAKTETLGAFEISNKATLHGIGMLNAGLNYGAVCLACAIVAALGESGALDPKNVIRWATWMAENQPPEIEGVSETAASMMRNFTKILEGFAPRN